MKKITVIVVMAALIVSLSGCGNTDQPQTIQNNSGIETVTSEIDRIAEPEESSTVSVSESKESSDDSKVEVKAETESSQTETPQPVAESNPAAQTQSPQTAVPNDTPEPEPPKAVETIPEPKPMPTSVEEKPTPKPEQTESSQESIPPAESIVPDFNIDYWIGYARSYAASIGLNLSPTAIDCWDNPMIAGAHSKYLERDITDCLNCYKNIEDFTGVWVWAEPDGNGAYKLYIGYE